MTVTLETLRADYDVQLHKALWTQTPAPVTGKPIYFGQFYRGEISVDGWAKLKADLQPGWGSHFDALCDAAKAFVLARDTGLAATEVGCVNDPPQANRNQTHSGRCA
ncbi:hypothetical protein MOP88_07375 [Sphingomonas sp. WKB10]|nr:hypothetical protein [Sphingomonas sp. WKB10]